MSGDRLYFIRRNTSEAFAYGYVNGWGKNSSWVASQYASRIGSLREAMGPALADEVEHAERSAARQKYRIEIVSIPRDREHPKRCPGPELVVEWDGLDIIAAIAALDGVPDDDVKATGSLRRRLRGE